MSDVLIKAEGVSKKFAKDLKKSLLYGLADVTRGVLGKPFEERLRKDEFWAVQDVSFEVRRGECLGLIGHNGAGKSTLLKMLNGLIRPDKGRIEMRGRIGALIELGAGFNPILTGRENIFNSGAVLGFTRAEINKKFDEIVAFSELEDFLDMPVQSYSSGMKVRLGFAVAAHTEPDVLLIDEVLAVGDLGFRIKCMNRIAELLTKCAVIFVSHSMPQIARTCTRGILLDHGVAEIDTVDIGLLIERYNLSFSQEKRQTLLNEYNIRFENFVFNRQPALTNSIYSVHSESPIRIQFQMTIPDEIQYFSIHFPIVDMQMYQVAMTTSLSQYEIILNTKRLFFVDVQIPNVFSAGKYYLGISMIENYKINGNILIGRTFFKFDNCICFIVTNTALTVSVPILLKSDWQISNG